MASVETIPVLDMLLGGQRRQTRGSSTPSRFDRAVRSITVVSVWICTTDALCRSESVRLTVGLRVRGACSER